MRSSINTTGVGNTASGLNALLNNTTGDLNTAIGVSALYSNTTGSFNTAIGFAADVSAGNLTNATAIGNSAVVNASNKIRLGNAAVTVIEGQVAFTASSDKTKKENFQPVDGEEVLGKIRGFELSSWNFIGHDPKEFRHYGPMAQDFFAAFGHDGVGQIGSETTINSGDLAGILMIAVQALEKRTAELKQKEAQIAALAARLEAPECGNHSFPDNSGETFRRSVDHNGRPDKRPVTWKTTGATVLLSNHSEFDNAFNKNRMLAGRGEGPHPYEIGADWVQRYFQVMQGCARAAQLKLEQQLETAKR